MKNKRIVQAVAVIIVTAIITAIILIIYNFSNTKNISKNTNVGSLTQYTAEEIRDKSSEYGVSYIDVPENMMDTGRLYFCFNNRLVHFNTLLYDENGERENSVTVYDIQKDTFTKTNLDFSEITSDDIYIQAAAPYLDDEYVLLLMDNDKEMGNGIYQFYILILDSDFSVVRYETILYELWICQIAADDNGYIAIGGEGNDEDGYPIRIYDSDFNLVLTENSPTSQIYSMIGNINSRLAFVFYYNECDYFGVYNNEKNEVEYCLIPQVYNVTFAEYRSNSVLFVRNDTEIYTYGIGDDYITKIIDLSQYGINRSSLWYVVPFDGETYFSPIFDTDNTGDTILTQWAVISKDASDDDRQELTYAVTGSYPTKAVSDFNRESTEYFIKVVDYSDEDGLERLEKEIVGGNIPDILDCSDIDVEAYVEKGVLSEVSDVAENVGILDVFKSAMEIDGGLYDLPYSYYIGYLSGRTSLLPNTTEYTADEIREIIEANDITYLADSMLGYDFVLGMIRGNENYYLTSGAGVFSEDEFVSILSLVKDYGFSNNSFNSAIDQIVNLSFEDGDYLFSYGLVVDYATVGEISENASEYFATGVTMDGVTDPALLMTVTFGMTTACQSEDAFVRFVELVYDEEVTFLPLTEDQLTYTENAEDTAGETLAFIENAAKNGAQRNYCGYSSIIEDEIERMIDQNIAPEKIASEIQEKMSIYINEQGE